ncbi:DNA-binding transcriptional regulator LsrR (DeoR family) [Geodermatophilus bullaregiensis]|uniref:sugar-binding transcriptional regulator n=1 Tax=Geodermatophilus bullaregiensis TaxID=1564160 RepID=UPI00195D7105|nr:sugar-binding domain-containing protein [Geodermatophilus bullaregiensis]MBM7808264.1 DNA-binding transcriptional regulator LsrR (DeoR family) [Geodermatophilus bullaregiensis]
MADDRTGPAGIVLSASVARRFYLDGRSKVEIADEFGLSRFKVARLLDAARESGLVRIEIRHEGEIDVESSVRLRDRYGLQHAVVVDTPDDDAASLRGHLGRAAAQLLAEVITPDDVLGLAWARAVSAMAEALPPLPGTPVVQLTGVLSLPGGPDTSVDVVRGVARASGGAAHVFYAPFTVPDAATARALRQQPEVASAFAQLPLVTKAVAGVGQWERGQSTLYDVVSDEDRAALHRLGVCADVSGVFLSADGDPVHAELSERMIGIGADQMREIPEVIVIPYGTAKARAVRAALRSGLVGGIVTHTALAHAVLEE